jgi:hypothetical protein
MTDPRIVSALREATGEQLREDADLFAQLALAADSIIETHHYRRASALALAVAEMQERSANAIRQNPERPHVIFWSADPVGGMDWIHGDVGVNAERTLPAALAALLEGGR